MKTLVCSAGWASPAIVFLCGSVDSRIPGASCGEVEEVAVALRQVLDLLRRHVRGRLRGPRLDELIPDDGDRLVHGRVGRHHEIHLDVLPDQDAHRFIARLKAGGGDDEVVLARVDARHRERAVRSRLHGLHEAAGRVDGVDLRGRQRRSVRVRHLSADRGRRQLGGSRHCDRGDQQGHSN